MVGDDFGNSFKNRKSKFDDSDFAFCFSDSLVDHSYAPRVEAEGIAGIGTGHARRFFPQACLGICLMPPANWENCPRRPLAADVRVVAKSP